ncbi:VOC family protein [Allostreptomyces psammosilenae]|uniref:Putative enzyme related to lactoylglutathione lyase n=1 Tax=Allostreptomyces psammosilenae TaxID=1892865 RepID=A0A853ACW6_9ACTN|nr:VOC family protein [Allostreptomyces psammosilenae]NYI08192.1 putative enzyme related to lactoylglutathione lyase [Allostreptomyces psammosilenae]
MDVRIGMVTVDCAEPRELAAWWRGVVGGEVVMDADGWYVVLSGRDGGPALGFQKVSEPTPGKNRLHLDLASADMAATVAELVAHGAKRVDEHALEDGFAWTVLEDPEGNAFCVSGPHV